LWSAVNTLLGNFSMDRIFSDKDSILGCV